MTKFTQRKSGKNEVSLLSLLDATCHFHWRELSQAMGLLFQMPVEHNDLDDRISINKDGWLTIKSYGLPLIFWGYLGAILMVMGFMFLAIRGPLFKVLTGEDFINQMIGLCVLVIFILGPTLLLAFFFYEKIIKKKADEIIVMHRIFGLPIYKKLISCKESELRLEHFLDSPNMALKEKKQGLAGFENRGYYKLVMSIDGKEYLVDRNSRRGEMRKLKELLDSHI